MKKAVVLVSGATSGMGLETTLCLARQGYRVFAGHRSESGRQTLIELAAEADAPIVPIALDVQDPACVDAAVAAVVAQTGKLDILINNAGYGLVAAVEDGTDEEFIRQFDVNVFGVPLSIYVAATAMPETLHNAAIAIVDEDGSPLSGRIAQAFYPPHFNTPRLLTLTEMDAGMDSGDYTFVLDIPPDFQADVLAGMNAGATLDEIVTAVQVSDDLIRRPWLRPIYDEPEFVVRNVWRLYGGWWDGDPAHLKPPPAGALARELADLAGGADALAARAQACSEAGDHRMACQLVELAAQATDDPGIWRLRSRLYLARAEHESSLMAKGVFTEAARSGDEHAARSEG